MKFYYVFSVLALINNSNQEIASALCRDGEDAITTFRKVFPVLNSNGYAKVGETTYCIAERFPYTPISK